VLLLDIRYPLCATISLEVLRCQPISTVSDRTNRETSYRASRSDPGRQECGFKRLKDGIRPITLSSISSRQSPVQGRPTRDGRMMNKERTDFTYSIA
jgi:hypothetical protein